MSQQPDRAGLCTAHNRKGGSCGKYALPGQTVCRQHGGASPQAQRCAKERLAALVDPAIAQLARLLKSKDGAVSYRAVKDVLDRNGFKPKDEVELGARDGQPLSLRVVFVSPPKDDEPASR